MRRHAALARASLGRQRASRARALRFATQFGDPGRASEELDPLLVLDPTTDWVRVLHLAVASLRAGDHARATALVRIARSDVALLGDPELPWRTEPVLVHQLAPVWDECRAPVEVRLLGRLAVVVGDREVALPAGGAWVLLKHVALRGRLSSDEAIDVLWPAADEATGRQRLRNLLNRLKVAAGPVVVRMGPLLTLGDDVVVDVDRFEASAERALRSADDRAALDLALSRYGGELLPGDHDHVVAARRERLRRRHLEVLDRAIDRARSDGDRAEASRLVDVALAAEPGDEHRAVLAARLLVEQGRLTASAEVLRRTVAALSELGLEPGNDLRAALDAARAGGNR